MSGSTRDSGAEDGEVDRFPEMDPGASGLHAAWYEANRAAGHLTAQRCACGVWRHPARYRCTGCRSGEWEFAPVPDGARGVVQSWTVSRRAFHGAFAEVVPFPIVVLECAEGLRFFLHVRAGRSAAAAAMDGSGWIGESLAVYVDAFGVPFAHTPPD